MLQIRCPNCGVRDEIEFRFGGEAGIERPDVTVNEQMVRGGAENGDP